MDFKHFVVSLISADTQVQILTQFQMNYLQGDIDLIFPFWKRMKHSARTSGMFNKVRFNLVG